MKRLLLMTILCLAVLQTTWAKLTVTEESDGTVVSHSMLLATLNMNLRGKKYAQYEASSFYYPLLKCYEVESCNQNWGNNEQ